jgi:hypothetical protein
LIRQALAQALQILGRQFVMGRTIADTLQRAMEFETRGYSYFYNMLGEAVHTAADAERYFDAYAVAITAIAAAADSKAPIQGPGTIPCNLGVRLLDGACATCTPLCGRSCSIGLSVQATPLSNFGWGEKTRAVAQYLSE